VILLLPAFAPEAKYSWFKQIKTLKKKYRVIMPNLLYFGKSTQFEKSFNVSDQVLAIKELLRQLKISEISILSASYGGLIAIDLHHEGSIKIKKLVLSSPKLIYDANNDEYIQPGTNEPILRSSLLVPGNAKELKRLFDFTYYRKLPIPFFVFKNLYKNLYHSNLDEKRNLVRACKADQNQLNLKKGEIQFPILIIYGEKDKLVLKEDVLNLQEIIGQSAELIIIPQTAHMPNYEKPKTYNKILNRFL